MYKLFYKPDDAYTGDFIPFWKNGRFHLFYLKDWRNTEVYGEGVPWFKITTDDFIHFDECGEMIARGTKEEQDCAVYTGSVIEAMGKYHIFYTGHNGHFVSDGRPAQGTMHAVSDDLENWTKIPKDTFYANAEKYEMHDFRDPFVYFDECTKRYNMLLVSRKKDSGYTAGFTALYSSDDLKTWRDDGDFFDPSLYHTHECPDFFKMGDWWYLIYSEYSDKSITRYVMKKDLDAPWIIPEDGAFDGRAYYAAKSYSDGNRRYLFGWVATKSEQNDDNAWQWGGNLLVHEIFQRNDGTLGCRTPNSVDCAWHAKEKAEETIILSNNSGKDEKLAFSGIGSAFRVDATIKFDMEACQFGMQFGQNFAEKCGYKYEFIPYERMLRFNSITSSIYTKDVTRPIDLESKTSVDISLIVDNDICVLYVDKDIALTSRIYNIRGKDVSFFVTGGSVRVENAVLSEMK